MIDSERSELPNYPTVSMKAGVASHPEYNPGPCIAFDCHDSNILYFIMPVSFVFVGGGCCDNEIMTFWESL